MNVRLPSGHVAPLEPAGLMRLLACGGTISGLCRAVWAQPDVDVDTMIYAGRDDACAIARWALLDFCETDEAAELAALCQTYGQTPSERLGVTDRPLAFDFDQLCMLALSRYREQQAGEHSTFNSGGQVNG